VTFCCFSSWLAKKDLIVILRVQRTDTRFGGPLSCDEYWALIPPALEDLHPVHSQDHPRGPFMVCIKLSDSEDILVQPKTIQETAGDELRSSIAEQTEELEEYFQMSLSDAVDLAGVKFNPLTAVSGSTNFQVRLVYPQLHNLIRL
jgi:hypothetical protein